MIFLLFILINWSELTDQIVSNPQAFDLTPIPGGASNANYLLNYEDHSYFVRICPPATRLLQADMGLEYEVLKQLGDLGISPKPIYFNPEKNVLVIEYIAHSGQRIDLVDPSNRNEVLSLLHQIESSKVHISRTYRPYHDICELADRVHQLGDSLDPSFTEELLPSLKKIDAFLSKYPFFSLCHRDLHGKNIIKTTDRFYLIDWEYAVMSDPLFTLASMASVEEWDDAEMRNLLRDYRPEYQEEEFYRLYLYRIIADSHWYVWNHLQNRLSSLDCSHYTVWEKMFLEAALTRLKSLK